MRVLYVLYDDECGFCRRCAWWLAKQPQYVRLILWPRQSAPARRRFAEVIDQAGADEMILIGDGGEVYRGTKAYLMCLWALRKYRRWARRLSKPALQPLVRGAFSMVAYNRAVISRWVSCHSDDQLAADMQHHQPLACVTGPTGKGASDEDEAD